ncbi:hypothetical protein [Actinosynnema sp. NPDC023587]|uniref:hypothetical protein n=1 Tax=Actinosynnema sp. NPDC023587 TaxID=3154695 RepID=UPI00340C6370
MTTADDAERVALATAFEKELYDDHRFLARTTRYRAKAFLEAVARHGGVGAARIVLQEPGTSDDLTRLGELGKLAHSVEATVLRPKYEALFSPDERRIARSRLESRGFDVDRFLGGLHT